ncbi:hypothetical protein Rs2_04684 [Raphanus sativus]|nr:hypothetical protein Rs2_04684 [Raphanus sativus]
MQATIYVNQPPTFQRKLAVGTMYTISGFDVARCAQNYRLSDSSLLLRFTDTTSFEKLIGPVSPLPEEGFWFYIIGEVTAVKSTVTEPPKIRTALCDVAITLCLFDAQAVSFHKKLEDMTHDPKVIVATSINLKMVGGHLFLDATSGTHVDFDKETNAGESCFYKLVARDTGLPSAAPLPKRYAEVEPVTIAELNTFVITFPSQSFTPDGMSVRENIASGEDSGEASENAGKEPVGSSGETSKMLERSQLVMHIIRLPRLLIGQEGACCLRLSISSYVLML